MKNARIQPTFGGLHEERPVGQALRRRGSLFVKRDDGGAQWVLRVTVYGRRREMGLGGYPSLGLAEARKLADRWRSVAAAGHDPVKTRETEARAARREDISLAALTADAFEARKAELKGDGAAGRWLFPLTLHVLPKLGKVPVVEIDQRDIRQPKKIAHNQGSSRSLNQITPSRSMGPDPKLG